MEWIGPSALEVIAGWILLAALFVLREFVSGAMREAGKDFWKRVKHRAAGCDRGQSRASQGAGAALRGIVSRVLRGLSPKS